MSGVPWTVPVPSTCSSSLKSYKALIQFRFQYNTATETLRFTMTTLIHTPTHRWLTQWLNSMLLNSLFHTKTNTMEMRKTLTSTFNPPHAHGMAQPLEVDIRKRQLFWRKVGGFRQSIAAPYLEALVSNARTCQSPAERPVFRCLPGYRQSRGFISDLLRRPDLLLELPHTCDQKEDRI